MRDNPHPGYFRRVAMITSVLSIFAAAVAADPVVAAEPAVSKAGSHSGVAHSRSVQHGPRAVSGGWSALVADRLDALTYHAEVRTRARRRLTVDNRLANPAQAPKPNWLRAHLDAVGGGVGR